MISTNSIASSTRPSRATCPPLPGLTWTRTLAWAITAAAVLVGAAAIPFLLQFPRQHSAAHQHSQVAQIEHPRPFIAAPTNPAGHVPPHQRPDATHPEPIHLFAQSRPRPDSPFTLAPLLNKPVTDEPIEIKPITVAPIEIAALN